MGLRLCCFLVLLLPTIICTNASRYMNAESGSRHRLWPLPLVTPFRAQDDTVINIWPMPLQVSHGNVSVPVSRHMEISMTVAGVTESQSSNIIIDAFLRYKNIIFLHDESDVYSTELIINIEELYLSNLVVNISSDDDSLDLSTDESYHLYIPGDLSAEQAFLQATTVYGALRGLETFSQLCSFNFTSKVVEIRNAPWNIVDRPRFKYRGLLIDTSRHYQPIEALKRIIDSMAYAKLNVLHWHIVDEESFPIEIPSLPKLWIGSYTPSERYTATDAREIVGYAKARGINVMAEIDVPGHAESWGYGYPELWPSSTCREPLDVSNNFTFEVIDRILTDFRTIFPFGLFHLGGDEVNTDCWSNTSEVKQWLDDQDMTAHEAYVYFVLRAQQLALTHGWQPVNWEETFNQFADMLDPSTVVHNWLGPGVAPKVVKKGFQCIVSNQDVWYLDHLNVPWQKFYANEPLTGITNSSEQELVLGGEICMWGETADASDVLQTIWPRAAAAAERLWSTVDYTSNSLDEVEERLEHFRCELNRRNIPAAPVTNRLARTAPLGPGSCYFQ